MKDLFSIENYRFLFVSRTISLFGSSISYIALMQKFYELSGSAENWAYLVAVKALPYLLFGLFLGFLIDKKNKKNLLLFSDICRCFIFIFIAYSNSLTELYFLVFLSSFFDAIYEPGFKSIVLDILSKEPLFKANSLHETSRSLLAILGLSIGGILVKFFGVRTTLLIDAGTYLLSGSLLLKLRLEKINIKKEKPSLKEIFDGLLIILKLKELKYVFIVWTIYIIIVSFEYPLFFPFVTEKEWGGAIETGYLYAAVSIGSLLTSLYLIKTGINPLKKKVILPIVIAIDATMIAALYNTSIFIFAFFISILLGVIETLVTTHSITEVQLKSPDSLKGRVFSVISMVQEPCRVIAMFLSGIMISKYSASYGFYWAALLEYSICFLLIAFLLFPYLKKRFNVGA